MEADWERLARDGVRDATRQEVQQLKQLVCDLSLDVYRLKKAAIPMSQDILGAGQVGLLRLQESNSAPFRSTTSHVSILTYVEVLSLRDRPHR